MTSDKYLSNEESLDAFFYYRDLLASKPVSLEGSVMTVNHVSRWHVARLRKLGYTVSEAGVITGGTDGGVARVLVGGRNKVTRLRALGTRT